MRSPLPAGTILQGRYRLQELMAEGGFARTYLAQDQGRFNERCVVKEFCPSSGDVTVFKKAKELFQREAETLYAIEHDQVPKFRALFTTEAEQDLRLFLVQDFVAGQTYRAVLQNRLQQNQPFSEAEVRQILLSLLPVLSHIHGQGIIHRDISLENLMLRSPDQTPVLIDFGVVKTVVSQLQQSRIMPVGTVVGKFGYAPVEQLQSGRAYPSSDLYSLAVCCLVLLTGLEPSQLFDDGATHWNWRSQVNVSDGFAALLDRMLSHKPSDRFSSADEIFQALQALPDLSSAVLPIGSSANAGANPSLHPNADLNAAPTALGTIAVSSPDVFASGRRPQGKDPAIPPVRGVKAVPKKAANQEDGRATPTQKSGILWGLGLLMAIASLGLGWFVMQLALQRPWRPQPTTPTAETRSPIPTPSPPNIRYSEALDLTTGRSTTVQSSLNPGESQTYQFSGTAEQTLSAQLSGAGVTFSILQSDLTPVSPQTQSVTTWRGTLPSTGPYYIQVKNDSAETPQPFQLNLTLLEPAPTPTVEPTPDPSSPTPSPSPTPSTPPPASVTESDLNLEPQGDGDSPRTEQTVSGELAPNQIQRYALSVEAGQTLAVSVSGESPVTLTIRNPAGEPLNDAQKVLSWESVLSEPGVYQIDVVAIDASVVTSFAIAVGLR